MGDADNRQQTTLVFWALVAGAIALTVLLAYLDLRMGIAFAIICWVGMAGMWQRREADVRKAAWRLARAVGEFDKGVKPKLDAQNDAFEPLEEALNGLYEQNEQQAYKSAVLIDTSQAVVETQTLAEGMQALMTRALDASEAEGARAVIVNPYGGKPYRFGNGVLSNRMGGYDEAVLIHIRKKGAESYLENHAEVRSVLELVPHSALPFTSVLAYPLFANGSMTGGMWFGYREDAVPTPAERAYLRQMVSMGQGLVAKEHMESVAGQQRGQMAGVLNQSRDAIIMVDAQNRITAVNQSMLALFETAERLHPHQATHLPVREVFRNRELVALLADSAENANAREIASSNNTVFHASASSICDEKGVSIGKVVSFFDVTEYKDAEASKDAYVQMVNHDLQNPINIIRRNAESLESTETDGLQKEIIAEIKHNAERMESYVKNVLDLGRIERGLDPSGFRPQDVGNLLGKIQRAHDHPARQQGNTIVIKPLAQPLSINGDAVALDTALTNLVTNALKYAAGTGEITLGAYPDENQVLITVSDRGNGIPKSEQLKIFEQGHRVAEIENTAVRGSGLGLSMVHSIAEQHKGRVWVDSDLGRGSTFTIALPRVY